MMADNGQNLTDPIKESKLNLSSLIFLGCGLLVFLGGLTFTESFPTVLRYAMVFGLPTGFLVLSWGLYQTVRLQDYWRISLAFGIAATALLAASYSGEWGLQISRLEMETANGFAVFKMAEDLAVAVIIILLVLVSKEQLGAIFLKWGNLKPGLLIGRSTCLILSLIALYSLALNLGGFKHALRMIPAVLVIAIADGFMKELLFRGLFLRKFSRFIGPYRANVITSVIFALAHLEVEFPPFLPGFIILAFLLGLLFGWIMQRTDSILAPALLHAGIDTLIIQDAFASYGISP
jgi:membrane protease YdiL (CAAX protease family)